MKTAGERGRNLATMALEEIENEPTLMEKRVVFNALLRALQAHRFYSPSKEQLVTQPDPMNDAQAGKFEETKIPFGKYQGRLVKDIPLSYLCRLADPNDWIKELRRYLANHDVQHRLEVE